MMSVVVRASRHLPPISIGTMAGAASARWFVAVACMPIPACEKVCPMM
jgi:hypothetical protein